MAKSIKSILPDLTFEEALEITKVYSVSGNLKHNNIICERPFRNPHHTISQISMVGGGKNPIPGEISLAHLGVLFLDELPEFKKSTLESLREPLEDKKIIINRVNNILEYPSNFMLVASMNPCPCGYYGSNEKECVCSFKERKKYVEKISGPLLDRIDINVQALPVKYEKIIQNNKYLTSEEIKKKVDCAKNIQIQRYSNENIFSNSELTPELIEKFCKIDIKSQELIKKAFSKIHLSVRGYNKILKVARTIADLDNKENIELYHLAEAIQYRNMESEEL